MIISYGENEGEIKEIECNDFKRYIETEEEVWIENKEI